MSDIYLSLAETPAVVTLSQPVVSGVLSSTVTVGNTVTVALDANSLSALENVTVTVGAAVSVSNFPASQVVTGSVAVTTMPAISISSVSISNFPSTQTIAGTVTANVAEPAPGVSTFISESGSWSPTYAVGIGYNTANNTEFLAVNDSGNNFPVAVNNSVTIGSLPAISGTVTANLNTIQEGAFGAYDSGSGTAINQNLAVVRGSDAALWLQDGGGNVPISGTVTANVPNADTFIKPSGAGGFGDALEAQDDVSAEMCVAVHIQDQSGNVLGASKDFPISGTVTANNPNGALTTRFGSVATANLAFITSAVTNTSRKYLLAQNISAGTVTIGIGFSPTTTQGIQLPAGGGLTFDAFCPTGAVFWLGAVTGAAFTILEG